MKQLFFLFALCLITSLSLNAQVSGGSGSTGGAGSQGGGSGAPKSGVKYKSPDGSASIIFDNDSKAFTPSTGTTAKTFSTDATRKGGFKYNRGANKNRPVEVEVDATSGDLVIYEVMKGKRGKALERWRKSQQQ